MNEIELTFIEKVATCQAAVTVPKTKNDAVRYMSRSAEDIQSHAKPILAEHGLVITLEQDIKALDGRFFIVSTATITGENGDTVTGSGIAQLLTPPQNDKGAYVMNEAQASGATGSYSDKIALENVLGIGSANDADHQSYQPNQEYAAQSYTPKVASEKQIKFAESLLEKADKDEARAWYKAKFGNKPTSALTSKECSEFIAYLKAEAPEANEPTPVNDLSEYSDETF